MTQPDCQSRNEASTSPEPSQTATMTLEVQNDVPAVCIPLTGEHLIEASAGTGKTWTLTGILLRLLIEAKRPPEQIIATTFTRAAAAEMRQRVHDRLIDFYQVLQWVSNLQDNPDFQEALYPKELQILPDDNENTEKRTASQKASHNNTRTKTKTDKKSKLLDPKARAELIEKRQNWLKEQAKLAGMSEKADDPINLHLVGFLLDHIATYPLADAIRRTELILTTLDKLFVGTLDSLAQKWLAEYSAETGYQKGMGITDDVQVVTDAIIHDELRRFQSQLYFNQPKIYQLLQQQDKLTTIDDHRGAVKKALTFISAPIDEVNVGNPFDFIELEALLDEFKALDLQDVEPYFDSDYRSNKGISAGTTLGKKLDLIPEIQLAVQQYGSNFLENLSNENMGLYDAIKKLFPNAEGKTTGFKTKNEENYEEFINLPTIKVLKAIHDQTDALDNYLNNIITNLNRNIAISVRDKLASRLEERNETTFTLQMVRLNQALSGRQGQKLARYIRHHYPVALIDESQDINGEQAQMIERIYLSSQATHNPTHEQLLSGVNPSASGSLSNGSHNEKKINTFLLLVGDPKQAIYGFRGGDVANYNYMKAKFGDSIMTLNLNRRSNAQLIDALNHWFGCPEPLIDIGEADNHFELTAENKNSLSKFNDLSELGENIHYQYIEAHNQTNKLSWQIDIEIDNNLSKDEADADEDSLKNKEGLSPQINDLLPAKPVTLIHIPKDHEDYDEAEVTALHIAALLKSQQTIEGRPIYPSDIAVLGRKRIDLKKTEDFLTKFNVPTLTTSEVSIFETTMAADLASLMEAMLRSSQRGAINRALTSQFFGLSLREVKVMMTSHDQSDVLGDESTALGENTNYASRNALRYQDFVTHIKEAGQKWQKRGILPALHYLLGKSPIHAKGAWQTLAALPEGERHIMDLRHLLDILAEYTMNMGEHELLSWHKQNMDKAPTEEWAKQQPLPTESGVQLMTIHKSKGLEFPIVYVLGMDSSIKPSTNKLDFYLYDEGNLGELQRQLSATLGNEESDNYYANLEAKESFNELKRLGYVAFTRPSEQLYIVIKDDAIIKKYAKFSIEDMLVEKYSLKPMKWWLFSKEQYTVPNYLKDMVGVVNNIKMLIEDTEINKLSDISAIQKLDKTTTPINYPDLDKLMPSKFFYGWAKTSFTALARQLDEQSQDVAVMDERIDDDLYIASSLNWERSIDSYNIEPHSMVATPTDVRTSQLEESYLAVLKPIDDIRFSFVKGANAGTFLHEIFEKIDFINPAPWSAIIDKGVRDYQLPMSYASANQQQRRDNSDQSSNDILANDAPHQALINWIEEVIETPLLASNQPLKAIPVNRRFAELSFNMGLSEGFKAENINKIFRQYLPDEPDKHVVLTPHNIPHLYRYLRGEIDLVYEHAGKFYVVDYKSNYLGNSLSDYNQKTLIDAMSKAGYWLQAAIYQVALHRFLSMRIADYVGNESQYLGAVEYVFLRGTLALPTQRVTNEDDISDNLKTSDELTFKQRFGLVKWNIPLDFIKALDAEFGKPSR